MKIVTVLSLLFITSVMTAQDTIKYKGIIAKRLLYDSIELYPDNTFKWTSEYDLSFSSYGKFQMQDNTLKLDFYIDWNRPKTMTLADSIQTIKKPYKSQTYIMLNERMYRTNEHGKKLKRIKDQSIKTTWSWLLGHQFYYIKSD